MEQYAHARVVSKALVSSPVSTKSKMGEQIGYQLLQKTPVQLAIAEARKQLQERTQITAEKVVNELALIAFADARELAEVKTGCCRCRCCWGEGFKFQRTVGEYTPLQRTVVVIEHGAMAAWPVFHLFHQVFHPVGRRKPAWILDVPPVPPVPPQNHQSLRRC